MDAPVGDKAVGVNGEGGLLVVGAGEDEVLVIPGVHALDDGLGAGAEDLSLAVQRAQVGSIEALQGGDVAQLIGEVVQHALDVAPGGLELAQDGPVIGVLGVDGVEGAVDLEGAGGGGGVGGIGVELPPRHDLHHGVVEVVGDLGEVITVIEKGTVCCDAYHSSISFSQNYMASRESSAVFSVVISRQAAA